MNTCIEARDALSKIDGVIRAHPFALNGSVLVYVANQKALTEEKVKEALKTTKDMSLRKMEPFRG
jgi:hypothetical protein